MSTGSENMMTPLETDRLILRTPIPDDAEFYETLENNPRVKRFVGGPSSHTADRYRQNITLGLGRQRDKLSTLTVIRRDSGTIIGRAGILKLDNHEIEVHCVLAEEYWGQRFGLEILNSLIELCKKHFTRKQIVGKVHPDNTAIIRIIERRGFREAGLIQSDGFDNGFRKFIFE